MDLPTEIIEIVIDFCHNSPSTLSAFSQTASRFKNKSQRHLFYHPKLTITWATRKSPPQQLRDVLIANPSLALLVKGISFDLEFNKYPPPGKTSVTFGPSQYKPGHLCDSVLPILSRLTQLQTLCVGVSNDHCGHFAIIPLQVGTDMIFHSVVSTQIRSVQLYGASLTVPASFFVKQKNLRHWSVRDVSASPFRSRVPLPYPHTPPATAAYPVDYPPARLETLELVTTTNAPWVVMEGALFLDVLLPLTHWSKYPWTFKTSGLRALRVSVQGRVSQAVLSCAAAVINNAASHLERLEFVLHNGGCTIDPLDPMSPTPLATRWKFSHLLQLPTIAFYQLPPRYGEKWSSPVKMIRGVLDLLGLFQIPSLRRLVIWLYEPSAAASEGRREWCSAWDELCRFLIPLSSGKGTSGERGNTKLPLLETVEVSIRQRDAGVSLGRDDQRDLVLKRLSQLSEHGLQVTVRFLPANSPIPQSESLV